MSAPQRRSLPVQCPTGQACTLDCLDAGHCGKVLQVSGDVEFRRRMLEMGFCSGTNVELVRRAPFGDPIEFKLRGYCLSLRNEQARNVVVRVEDK